MMSNQFWCPLVRFAQMRLSPTWSRRFSSPPVATAKEAASVEWKRASTMARRELSSTLKNLKFMQRASQKDENAKKVEKLKRETSFAGASSPSPVRRCVVIMEGNPHPGALRGRMSFQSFNPSVDKLNEEATNICEERASSSTADNQNGGILERGGASAAASREDALSQNASDMELKRKQPEEMTDIKNPQKLKKVASSADAGQPSSGNNMTGPYKQKKHGKLDWNVLRPPKASKS